MMRLFLFLIFTIPLSAAGFGQKSEPKDNTLLAYGTLKDQLTSDPLSEGYITLIAEGDTILQQPIDGKGRFEFNFYYDNKFVVYFNCPGYQSKHIEINTHNVPKRDRAGGFGFDLDMSLLPLSEAPDPKYFEEPIGKVAFKWRDRSLGFDYDYSKRRIQEIEAARKRLKDN